MIRKKIYLAIGLVVLLAAFIIIGKNRKRGELEVSVGKIQNRTIISTVSANGKIRP